MMHGRSQFRGVVAACSVAIATSVVLSSCSSEQSTQSGSDPEWTASSQVISDVQDAGFDCSFENSDGLSQVITKNPFTEEPLGGMLVLCNGFQVFLVGEIDEYFVGLEGDCAAVTEEELASEAMQRVVVVGSNFVISGTGTDQAFPEGHPPSDFAQAFGASERTLGSLYEDICPNLSGA